MPLAALVILFGLVPNLLTSYWTFSIVTWFCDHSDYSLELLFFAPFFSTFKPLKNKKGVKSILLILLGLLLFFLPNYLTINTFIFFIAKGITLSIILYYILYDFLGLDKSILSFIFFMLNILLISLMIFGFCNACFILNEPILLDNLSYLSAIKYLLFVCCTILIALVALIIYIKPIKNIKEIVNIITYPYLQEEFYKIYKTQENNIFGPFFSNMITHLTKSNKVLFIHFFFTYLIPIIQLLFFINFVFFEGDLRYCLYLLPLSLLSFIFKSIWFYFQHFFENNCQALRESVIILNNEEVLAFAKPIENGLLVEVNLEDIKFELNKDLFRDITEPELQVELLEGLKTSFLECACVESKKLQYNKYTKYIGYILFFFKFICWCQISLDIFFNIKISVLTQTILTKKISIYLIPKRFYPTETFIVKKNFQPVLEKQTQGDYKKNHYVTSDAQKIDNKGEVPYYHSPTHGVGPLNNKSKLLHPTKDLQGNSSRQYAVYPKSKLRIPYTWFEKPLPNSIQFYKDPLVKSNDDANDPNYAPNEKL